MYIFVDESGGFTFPKIPHRVSGIGAVVVPEAQRRSLTRSLQRLWGPWEEAGQELKGSQLLESQVAAAVSLIKRYDVILQVCAIDMGMHTPAEIEQFRAAQADRITAGLTPQHSKGWWDWATRLRQEMLNLSPQLFVQSMLVMTLLADVLQNATVFYVLRSPRELGKFRWRVDAKDVLVTPFEKLWTELLLPMVQSRSMGEPLVTITGANYAYFDRFNIERADATKVMREHMEATGRLAGTDLRKVYREDFEFVDSKQDIGVRLADILVNAVMRAMNGTLSEAGWSDLGSLFVQGIRPGLTLVSLEDNPPEPSKTVITPYGSVVRKLLSRRREMFPSAPAV